MSPGVGLLGGTFDPPHAGHVMMAVTARRVVGLDRVFLVPAVVPPHKRGEVSTPYSHRLQMTEIAARSTTGVDVLRETAGDDAPSYTVDLLRRVSRDGWGDIYFIVGADSFRDLSEWKDPEEILAMCTLVVFPRENIPAHTGAPGPLSAVVIEHRIPPFSSREIRRQIASGTVVGDALPPGVLDYALDNRLYRTM